MSEFFGFNGYSREPEGYFSWQHLVFVSSLMLIMIALAVFLGLRNRHKDDKIKNKVLIVCAIAINAVEILKIVLICIRSKDALAWLNMLPLFLCSIQLITIPLAAFAKGRVKEAALDFVFIFGILGAVMGTYAAGQNYASYPVLSLDNVASGITHTISGFVSLYIGFANMTSMKKENIIITFAILLSFCVVAYVVNIIIDYNYMFLMRGDGTPYDLVFNLVGGNPVLYPILVALLFVLYVSVFYLVFNSIKNRKKQKTH